MGPVWALLPSLGANYLYSLLNRTRQGVYRQGNTPLHRQAAGVCVRQAQQLDQITALTFSITPHPRQNKSSLSTATLFSFRESVVFTRFQITAAFLLFPYSAINLSRGVLVMMERMSSPSAVFSHLSLFFSTSETAHKYWAFHYPNDSWVTLSSGWVYKWSWKAPLRC